MACTVVWFRRDLRVGDNPALIAAARAGIVIPVFVWSPEEEGQFHPGRVSRWWLKQSLIHLDMSLRSLGSPLIMRKSHDTLAVLIDVIHASGASQVFYNHLYDPVSLVRDHRVKQGLTQHGISVHTFNGDLLYEPWEVYDEEGQAFTTYDAYWQKCLAMPFEPEAPLLPPKRIRGPTWDVSSCSAEELGLEDDFEKSSNALLARAWSPGWANADKALDAFLRGPLIDYAANRQKADSATTSLLSPHLHFGEVSVRKLFHDVHTKQLMWAEDSMLSEQSVSFFLRAIGFREYSRYLSFNFPFTHERSLLANLKSFPWRVDEGYFKAWRQGRTGYPLVDAGMRELWATGWLHNRIRVVVSSFCVKFLQLPWRWGMKYFWDTLLDADLECDVLGWQYISGSLPDGHELDRMENPQTEGYKFDPEGEYVRRWLPELSRLPTEWIHHPWDAPPSVLRAAGVELGSNYPRPIVEISAARERLQQALAKMWEREAALKAARANGPEEGLGETFEVVGTGGPAHEKMDVHRVIVRNKAISSCSSRRDQMVPSMPTESQQEAAASILNLPAPDGGDQSSHALVGRAPSVAPGESITHHEGQRTRQAIPSAPLADSDLDSTAESSSAAGVGGQYHDSSRAGTVPVWSPPLSGRPCQAEEGIVPVVPGVPDARRGVMSRRHIHPAQMVNLEAMTVTKAEEEASHLMKRIGIRPS